MRRIIVLNTKGGCGKTTIATNLASLYAARGFHTALYDYDPQASSSSWLELRPSDRPPIYGVATFRSPALGLTRSWQIRLPANTERLIIDTPASLGKPELLEQIRGVDQILVPLAPSAIDIRAAADFIRSLIAANKTIRARIGIIANRVREHSPGLRALQAFLDTVDIPLVTRLRDSQNYLLAADQGLGVHELDTHRARFDIPHWERLLEWLETPPAAASQPLSAHAQLLRA